VSLPSREGCTILVNYLYLSPYIKLFKFQLFAFYMKKICFFSVGFAFNRLVRMRFYEKIFPKNVEMFLFTTNKYEGREKEKYQYKWDLKRTKIITAEYHPLKLPFALRKFCIENEIDRVINIGNWRGAIKNRLYS